MVKCNPDIKTKFEIHHCGKNIIDLKDEDDFLKDDFLKEP